MSHSVDGQETLFDKNYIEIFLIKRNYQGHLIPSNLYR